MRAGLILSFLFLVGCVEVAPTTAPPQSTARASSGPVGEATLERIASRLIPIAVRECRERSSRLNCDFQVAVDRRADQPPNAFQTESEDGRPLLIFNTALLADLQNSDELAFILGHEAAHHIEGHLAETNRNATAGALFGGLIAGALGADPNVIDTTMRVGGAVGARAYSKDFELEADALGARITKLAGYDPVRGAAYFTRIADPGNTFLGTHPPNAARIETVRRAANGV